ncbi:hypothetical protein V5O48_019002, partial [Marasmius crinis-equi]
NAPFYSKSLAFREDTMMSADTIQSVFELFDSKNKGSPGWFAIFHLVGGAMNDVPIDATGYPHRDVLYFLESYIVGIPTITENNRKWLNDLIATIENSFPNGNLGAYAGYVDPFLPDGQNKYWKSNYPKLRQVKREVDPGDTFHNPQSVVPAEM